MNVMVLNLKMKPMRYILSLFDREPKMELNIYSGPTNGRTRTFTHVSKFQWPLPSICMTTIKVHRSGWNSW